MANFEFQLLITGELNFPDQVVDPQMQEAMVKQTVFEGVSYSAHFGQFIKGQNLQVKLKNLIDPTGKNIKIVPNG